MASRVEWQSAHARGFGSVRDVETRKVGTPLWRAVMNPSNAEVIAALLASGASPHKRNKSRVSALDIAKKMGNADLVAVLGEKR